MFPSIEFSVAQEESRGCPMKASSLSQVFKLLAKNHDFIKKIKNLPKLCDAIVISGASNMLRNILFC